MAIQVGKELAHHKEPPIGRQNPHQWSSLEYKAQRAPYEHRLIVLLLEGECDYVQNEKLDQGFPLE